MNRTIVNIDEEKCNGCGLCIPNCHEGALQLIDGKARLIGDVRCDGLGDCLGHCPQNAIALEEREAEPYDEKIVMETMVKTIGGCPGSRIIASSLSPTASASSELKQWPVQLHLVNPTASYFHNADVVLSADCVAYSMGNFHRYFLKGKSLAIACPKLDTNKEVYVEKLTKMISESKINTLTAVMMEVPCCGGLMGIAQMALQRSVRKIPLKQVIISIQGEIISEDWI